MNPALFSRLLSESESSYLDFKRDQYKFVKATDTDKAKLLKDILALANAWRRETAYILVGVEEVKPPPSIALGIAEHLEDADVQTFVNNKTSRMIQFSCQSFAYEDRGFDVIEIPCQVRPFRLKKDYGGLEGGRVYVRRGTSTDIADASEAARMEQADTTLAPGDPRLDVQFADHEQRCPLGSEIHLVANRVEPSFDVESAAFRSAYDLRFALRYDLPSWANSSVFERRNDNFAAKALRYLQFLVGLQYCT